MNVEAAAWTVPSACGAHPVGVIGAGQMGNGISHVCALAGLPVMLLDAKPTR